MRTLVITGASDGIGAAAARILEGPRNHLVLVGRNTDKTAAIARDTGADALTADFTDLAQVRALATTLLDRYPRIDVLANNAGGLYAGPELTGDGFEKSFQINHLAPFLLTHLLMDRLMESRTAVVNTSSFASILYARPDLDDPQTLEGFTENRAYGNAKLWNILFTKELHRRFHTDSGPGIDAVAFHPGVIRTNFAADAGGYPRRVYHSVVSKFLASAHRGGQNLVHFMTGIPGRTWESGGFYGTNFRPMRTHRMASDPAAAHTLWETSEEMLGLPADPATS
ncbi:SDR family NAD(P)-dependent oxidoreductase [Brevibacterium litoralis]|uniref:SDR family NAD(P)-dependent oxidoreductase n=1 Tax=Brevibacterium litoralis TaxID=3138935 RepID=UPI0032F01E85